VNLTDPARHGVSYSSPTGAVTFPFVTTSLWVQGSSSAGTLNVVMMDGATVSLPVAASWTGLLPLRAKGLAAGSSNISSVTALSS
jgi:hypothetical protein